MVCPVCRDPEFWAFSLSTEVLSEGDDLCKIQQYVYDSEKAYSRVSENETTFSMILSEMQERMVSNKDQLNFAMEYISQLGLPPSLIPKEIVLEISSQDLLGSKRDLSSNSVSDRGDQSRPKSETVGETGIDAARWYLQKEPGMWIFSKLVKAILADVRTKATRATKKEGSKTESGAKGKKSTKGASKPRSRGLQGRSSYSSRRLCIFKESEELDHPPAPRIEGDGDESEGLTGARTDIKVILKVV
jgi:hypothetical protein